ncbi:MAG: ABC transporter ATP-binding protein [Alphaproteobacteria bacterium]|nr:ABC transporter ATP-binding protein [Alphaproteobacteria bacterium]
MSGGKSVTALSLLRLVPMPGRIVAGSITLNGRDVSRLSDDEMRGVRRNEAAMIFQDASNFLNPIFSIGDQIAEGIADRFPSKRERRAAVIEALHSVRIPDPERVATLYPFQLSGGMQQRAVIAAATARKPSLVIADEPTTALDATVQFQILRLLEELQTEIGMSLILISHDLAVIASVCSRVYVMYAAEIVESGPTRDIYRNPAHPYTKALLGSILDPLEERKPLTILEGAMPDLSAPPQGCRFHPRCPAAMPICSQAKPPPATISSGHQVNCWLHAEPAVAA